MRATEGAWFLWSGGWGPGARVHSGLAYFPLKKLFTLLTASWRAGLLVAVTALIWCAHYDKWTVADWQVPTDYGGDAPEILAQMQAAADGDTLPLLPKVIDRLGAPFGADWNGYPTPDKLLMLVLGGLARFIGLFAAANVGMILTQVTAALSFYLVARWLRCRWEWAWAGALLFAFSYPTFHRGLAHFSVAITWTVPLGVLAAGLVARSRRLDWRSAGGLVCLGTAVALGVSTPYNLLFWLQLMTWAVVAQWYGARRRDNLRLGLAAMALAVAAFVAVNLEFWIHTQEPAGLPLVTRNYAGTEIYALKPMELFIPPVFHRWEAFAFLGHRYVRWSLWRGEVFLPYLGIFGIAGLLWLAAVAARRIFARQPLPGPFLAIGWLVAYAAVGGLTNVVALFGGVQIFRATNRVVPFIAGLVLIFLVTRLSRLTRRWPSGLRLGAALGVAAVGLLDQIPRPDSAAERQATAADARADLQLGRELEAVLPPGAMVFQLPVMGFPEVAPPYGLSDYELFRPYLTTRTLRFSYGAAKFRARSQWQGEVAKLPAPALVARLEAGGFAALEINRKGYADRAEPILRELEAMGYTRRLEDAGENRVVVLLRPATAPSWPLAGTLTLGQGWQSGLEDGVRWATGDGVFSYFNPCAHPLEVELELTLVAPAAGEVALELAGRTLRVIPVDETPVVVRLPRLVLRPGVNRGALRPRAATDGTSLRRDPSWTFGLKDASIKAAAGADTLVSVVR